MKAGSLQIFLVLGDLAATISLFGSFVVRADTPPYVEQTIAPSSPSAGALLRELAMSEEYFYDRHHRYARVMSELAVPLPDEWHATILEISRRRYRIRLAAPTEDGRRSVCWVWGVRRDRQTVEPFQIDCRTDQQR